LCRYCHNPVKPPRRTFCDDDCVREYLVRRDPTYARKAVFKRDKGVCSACGTNTQELKKRLQKLPKKRRLEEAAKLGIPPHRVSSGSLWDADHILPVSEGGGECGLDNLQTLCIACHLKKTAAARRRRDP